MTRTPAQRTGGAPWMLLAASTITGLLSGTVALAESTPPPRLTLSVSGIKREAALELSRELRATVRGNASEGEPARLQLRLRPAPPIKTEDQQEHDEIQNVPPGGQGNATPREVTPPRATGKEPAAARPATVKKPARSSSPGRKAPEPASPGGKTRAGGISRSLLEDADRLARPNTTPAASGDKDPAKSKTGHPEDRGRLHAKPEAQGRKGTGAGGDRSPGPASRADPHGPPGTAGAGSSGTRSGGPGTGPGGKRR